MKKIFKIFLLFLILLALNLGCPIEYTVETFVYNMRRETIEICTQGVLSRSSEPLCSKIEPNDKRHGIDPHLKSKSRVSEIIDYMIVKDNNDVELLNLRGEALDRAFRIVEETDHHILYRLDVN